MVPSALKVEGGGLTRVAMPVAASTSAYAIANKMVPPAHTSGAVDVLSVQPHLRMQGVSMHFSKLHFSKHGSNKRTLHPVALPASMRCPCPAKWCQHRWR